MAEGVDETIAATRSTVEASTFDDAQGRGAPAPIPAQGGLVGRYVVLSQIGAGAMGVVLAAYDPHLDRKVALKLIRRRFDRQGRARGRLQREAQALARLNHPNVVAVHDVDVHEGQVFVAMEFVEGQTLREWMRQVDGRPRPWLEVLEVFRAAGEGLAAAHGQGLVHRDFKPDNVMVGSDGRVRVMDFGLARASSAEVGSDEAEAEAEAEAGRGSIRLDASLTRTGAAMGTPAYMAPEQFEGVGVSERSDQFGFCVSLYEALFGQSPFDGDTSAARIGAIVGGQVREPPSGSSVPRWVLEVVTRGLAPGPSDRFATMGDLLAALAAGEIRQRRRRWMGVGGAVLVVSVAVAAGAWFQRRARVDDCIARGSSIDEVWGPAEREVARRGLEATGLGHAALTADKSISWMDEHAEAWRARATEACLATEVEQTWEPATYERASWCLEDRRLALETLAAELGAADERVVANAVQAAAGLPSVEPCVNVPALARMQDPPPPALRPRLVEARRTLRRARTLEAAGKYDEGLEAAREAGRLAESLSWPPSMAAALAAEASLLGRLGRNAESEAKGLEAYVSAARSESWDVAAAASADLVFIVGYALERHGEGRTWAEHAGVAVSLAGDPLGLREARLASNLGSLLRRAGDLEEARREQERALAIRERALGGEHPTVGLTLVNLGNVFQSMGDHAEAVALHERAVTVLQESFGPFHPQVATGLESLAISVRGLGDLDAADQHFERALAVRERALGPDHPDVARNLHNLGLMARARRDWERSIELHERSAEIWQRAFGPRHPTVAFAHAALGLVYRDMERPEDARVHYEQALEIQREALGPDHPDAVRATVGLAKAWRDLGRPTEAIAILEPVAASSVEDDGTGLLRAEARFLLGQALWERSEDGDRVRARALVDRARELYAAAVPAGALQPSDLEPLDAWLEAHPEPGLAGDDEP